jgi:hypothetical protein
MTVSHGPWNVEHVCAPLIAPRDFTELHYLSLPLYQTIHTSDPHSRSPTSTSASLYLFSSINMATAIEYGSSVRTNDPSHFESKARWNLAMFFYRLHSSPQNPARLKVEFVSFHYEYDNMDDSGVMQLLGSE